MQGNTARLSLSAVARAFTPLALMYGSCPAEQGGDLIEIKRVKRAIGYLY